MKTLIKVALTAAVGLAAFVSPAEAGFREDQCRQYPDGGVVCMDMTGRKGPLNYWEVGYDKNGTTEYFEITCTNKSLYEWSSYGNMSEAGAEAYAYRFCSL